MEEWYAFNQERIKYISLLVACLVLGVTIYRWLIYRWRADVSLRKYAHFNALASARISVVEELIIDIPIVQDIRLSLEGELIEDETLYEGRAEVGQLKVHLDMSAKRAGEYQLVMQTDDQKAIKRIIWSGLDLPK